MVDWILIDRSYLKESYTVIWPRKLKDIFWTERNCVSTRNTSNQGRETNNGQTSLLTYTLQIEFYK